MMRALMLISAVLALGAAPATLPSVRLTEDVEVAAPPARVWEQVTVGRHLVVWCPVWKSEGNTTARISAVGDVLQFRDAWGNRGRSVVTYLVPLQEVRVTHEPDDGSYVCQARLVLTPTAKGTRVRWMETYTDDSPPKDRDATAQKTLREMRESLTRLKAGAER